LDKNKAPRFFCDNCGYEVGHEVKSCPYCGRFFASVRCPVCDYAGPEKMFANGCPLCGYSAAPSKKPAPKKPRAKKPKHRAEPLPMLAYIITGVALLAAIAVLAHFITR